MSWLVVREFADAQDSFHVYKAGDSFPRDGVKVGNDRISKLASGENAIGSPVIKEIAEIVERKTESKPKSTKAKPKTKE